MTSSTTHEEDELFIALNLESFGLGGAKPIHPMLETLEGVKATLRKHFEIKDWQGVELILAAAVAHYAPGEMLWFREIGPSRSGKTELRGSVCLVMMELWLSVRLQVRKNP